MSTERRQSIYPAIRYRDADAGIAWLTNVLGFELLARFEGEDGRVSHAELRFDDDVLMLGSAPQDSDSTPSGLYLAVDDIDAHHRRAADAGGEISQEIVERPYGSREYAVQGPEGDVWYIGTYRPALEPEEV